MFVVVLVGVILVIVSLGAYFIMREVRKKEVEKAIFTAQAQKVGGSVDIFGSIGKMFGGGKS